MSARWRLGRVLSYGKVTMTKELTFWNGQISRSPECESSWSNEEFPQAQQEAVLETGGGECLWTARSPKVWEWTCEKEQQEVRSER